MTETSSTLGSAPYRTPARAPHDAGDVSVPYEGQTRMRLSIAHGLSSACVRIDPGLRDLITISGPEPRLRVTPGELRAAWPTSFGEWLSSIFAGHDEIDIALHPAVEWSIAAHGGVSRLRCHLAEGRVARIDVSGGCSDVELELPRPDVRVPIRISGGASCLRMRRPADVGVSVAVLGGVSSLRLDDRSFDAIGGEARLESPGEVRYDLRVSGGASDVDVEAA